MFHLLSYDMIDSLYYFISVPDTCYFLNENKVILVTLSFNVASTFKVICPLFGESKANFFAYYARTNTID